MVYFVSTKYVFWEVQQYCVVHAAAEYRYYCCDNPAAQLAYCTYRPFYPIFSYHTIYISHNILPRVSGSKHRRPLFLLIAAAEFVEGVLVLYYDIYITAAVVLQEV